MDASNDFSVTVTEIDPDRVLIVLLGELDLATAEGLWLATEPLLRPEVLVVVDAAKMPFLDSSGLRVLLQASRRCEEIGARFRVAELTGAVSRVVGLAGVGPQLDLRGTVADALEP